MLQRYQNLGGDSSVLFFELYPNAISVIFNDGSRYLYTVQSAGYYAIEEMKRLAVLGQGLCSFIQKNARKAYASKDKALLDKLC